MMRQGAIALRSIEIIDVDHGKGLVNSAGGHQNGVRRAPRPHTAGRYMEPRRKLVDFLKDVFHRKMFFKPRADSFLDLLLNAFADYENDPAEARSAGVVDRIVKDGLATGTNGFNQFQAAVTAAHASCQDKKR